MAAAVRVIDIRTAEGVDSREYVVEVTGDASYPTGGYAIGTAQGLPPNATILFATFEPVIGASATQQYTWQFDYVNNKLKVGRDNGEAANGANLSAQKARGLIIAR